jgi:hypothetical protein
MKTYIDGSIPHEQSIIFNHCQFYVVIFQTYFQSIFLIYWILICAIFLAK